MLDKERAYFKDTMIGLGELFNADISQAQLEFYWQALQPFSLSDFKKAVNNIVVTRKFPGLPKPVEFIEIIHPPEDVDARAELALEEFFERKAESGYESFEWRDPVLAMTVNHYGGWMKIIDIYPTSDLEAEKFWLIDFKKIYKIFLRYPRKTSMRFIGLFEADNRAKGYLTNDSGNPVIGIVDGERRPLLIGSPESQKYLELNGHRLLTGPDRPMDLETTNTSAIKTINQRSK
jgi:hypothetical protein